MRISKAPEERKQEIIDTAMQLFAVKGYETTTMTDIAKEMNVVSGLCYRYFKSKDELYRTALSQYAKECAAPFVAILSADYDSLAIYSKELITLFCQSDRKQKYHAFFHGSGNEFFHHQLEYEMIQILIPHMSALLHKLNERHEIQISDSEQYARFILNGQMPIINEDSIPTKQKAELVHEMIIRTLKPNHQ